MWTYVYIIALCAQGLAVERRDSQKNTKKLRMVFFFLRFQRKIDQVGIVTITVIHEKFEFPESCISRTASFQTRTYCLSLRKTKLFE